MSGRFFEAHILGPDTHANRPAANTVPDGALYVCSDHGTVDRNNAGTWGTWATLGSAYDPEAVRDTIGTALVAGSGISVTVNDPADTITIANTSTGDTNEVLLIAVSDETTVLSAGTAKVTFRMPFALTLTGVRASLTTANSSGGPVQVDINEGGVSILSTKLTIDDGEKTSTTAATAAVISDSSLADDAEITIDIDTAGTNAAGLKVALIGHR